MISKIIQGNITINNGDSEGNITISSVVMSRTMVRLTYRSEPIRVELTSSTNVRAYRSGSSGTATATVHVVEHD